MKLARSLSASVALFSFLGAVPAPGQAPNPWTFLPTRMLEIDGGAVAFQSAVILDLRQPLANPLLQKHPLRYILVATNESDAILWIEATWRVPGRKLFVSFGELAPGLWGAFHYDIKEVGWSTPIPIGVAIYADKRKSRKLGGRDVVLLFGEEDRETFMRMAKDVNSRQTRLEVSVGRRGPGMPLLPGFQEMDLAKPVPGSKADAQLAEDVKLLLWKNQSRRHWDCAHEVLGAREHDPAATTALDRLPTDTRRRIEEDRSRGDVTFEEWQVKSCDSVTNYVVAMMKSSGEGTDVIVVEHEGDPPR